MSGPPSSAHWILPAAIVGISLGFLLTLQVRAQITYKQSIAPSRRLGELSQAWRQAESRRTGRETEVAALRAKVLALGGNPDQPPAVAPGPIVDTLLLAGLTEVSGPGVVVVLRDDGDRGQTPVTKGLIADDLLKVINELRVAGAEALSLNGERLISQSEIVTAGAEIMVNQHRIGGPFEMRAIGRPPSLVSGLKAKGGILETLQFYAIRVTISPRTRLTVPAYQGRLTLHFAKPAPQPLAR